MSWAPLCNRCVADIKRAEIYAIEVAAPCQHKPVRSGSKDSHLELQGFYCQEKKWKLQDISHMPGFSVSLSVEQEWIQTSGHTRGKTVGFSKSLSEGGAGCILVDKAELGKPR